jgi:hypothetical protein
MSDRLTPASRALREMHDGSSPEAASTRRRILADAALRRRRHRTFAAVWMPLAAVLVVSSAWAAVTGRVPGLVALLRGAPHATAVAKGVATRPGASESETAAIPTSIPIPIPTSTSTSTSTSTPTSTATATAIPTSTSTPTSTPTSTRKSIQTPAPDIEDSLYSTAHHAHFVAHDPAAALKAWDDYLAAYPNGRFGLEARYNRALALVRLGRTDEARAALAPFADGRNGGYRQAEARSLLEAVGH